MTSIETVVLGTPGDRRDELTRAIKRRGYEAVVAESEFATTGDVLIVDLDDAPHHPALVDAELDGRPMLVLASAVTPELRRLMARAGDTLLVTDPSECGLRTALAAATGLVARHRAAPGRAVAWMAAAS